MRFADLHGSLLLDLPKTIMHGTECAVIALLLAVQSVVSATCPIYVSIGTLVFAAGAGGYILINFGGHSKRNYGQTRRRTRDIQHLSPTKSIDAETESHIDFSYDLTYISTIKPADLAKLTPNELSMCQMILTELQEKITSILGKEISN